MFSYNKDKNVLTISKIPVKEVSTVYQESDAYLSYKKYVDYGLLDDIKNILVPQLNKVLGGTEDNPMIWLDNAGSTVKLDATSTYKGYEYNSAFVRLCSRVVPFGGKKFCIFKLPLMDEFGLLNREGKQYVIKNELVQDDDVTFDSGELKIVTKRGCHIRLKKNAREPYVEYRSKKYPAIRIMLALAVKECINPEELLGKLKDKDLVNVCPKGEDLKAELEYEIAIVKDDGVLKAYSSDAYSFVNVRENLNNLLSINRALGHTTSRVIELKSGETIKAETIITSNLLKKLKYNKVNEVYVKEVPNMLGYFLAEDVYIKYFRKGTEMVSQLKDVLPDYRGMYLDRNMELNKAIIFEAGTPVSKGLLGLFAYNAVPGVELCEREGSDNRKYVAFEREIIGNRHFRKCDIGEGSSTDYVYVNEDGTVSPAKKFICTYDFLALISLYTRLVKNKDLDYIASVDLGLRKKVNQAYESFHKAFEKAVPEFARIVQRKLKLVLEEAPQNLNNPGEMETLFYYLSHIWWKKLGSEDMKVIDTPDLTNPVAFYSSLTKIVSNVKDIHAVKNEMRNLSMGHYGRVCPYETPQSRKLGIVNNLATGCRIRDGKMYTSYYKVKHVGQTSYVTDEVVWLTVQEEEQKRIADITSVVVDDTGKILTEGQVLARIPTVRGHEKMTVARIDISKIDLVNTDPNQTNSITTTTIPFQGADDAVRVSFGSGMCKQAKGLLDADVPIVLPSAYARIPRISPYFMINAEYDGEVVDIADGLITVYYYEINDTKSYKFKLKEFTTTSVIIRSVDVKIGDIVKAGDVLVSSNFTKDGYLAMGKNVIVGYIPKGYNYEDGVYASRRLQSKLNSYGANKEADIIPRKFSSTTVMPINKFKYVEKGKPVYMLKYVTRSGARSRVVKSEKLKGFLVNVEKEIDAFTKQATKAVAYSVSFDYLDGGDKLANRHGNKGVTPPMRENYEMPCFLNGEFLDICYNPMGVSSRMNIGQILECNCGLAGLVLNCRIGTDAFNSGTNDEIKYLLSYAWHMANDENIQAVNTMFPKLPDDFKRACEDKINYIRTWKDSFNEDGTAWLYNPTTGKQFEIPVVVGINYVYKLIHEGGKKIHARGGFVSEPYVEKTDAPTQGSANQGGQRWGNMEVYALLAYGASHFLQELMNERGDNAVKRNNLTVKALHTGDKYILPEYTGTRRSTQYFLNAMEALGVVGEFDNCELPNNTIRENAERKVYKADALILANDVGDKRKRKEYDDSSFAAELGRIKI